MFAVLWRWFGKRRGVKERPRLPLQGQEEEEKYDPPVEVALSSLSSLLASELEERIMTMKEEVSRTYQALDRDKDACRKKYAARKNKVSGLVLALLENMNIPRTDHYIDAHVFCSRHEKACKGFIAEERDNFRAKEACRDLLLLREHFLSLKQRINESNLLFYDVILEEIKDPLRTPPLPMIEEQLQMLLGRTVHVRGDEPEETLPSDVKKSHT